MKPLYDVHSDSVANGLLLLLQIVSVSVSAFQLDCLASKVPTPLSLSHFPGLLVPLLCSCLILLFVHLLSKLPSPMCTLPTSNWERGEQRALFTDQNKPFAFFCAVRFQAGRA